MKRLIAFSAVIMVVNASVLYPLNELGSYGVSGDTSSVTRQEIRTPDGILHGTYTYVDGEGKTQSVIYGSDAVTKAPEVVKEEQDKSSEVVESVPEGQDEAKEEITEDKSSSPVLPQPVQYTPEVAAARAAHFEARDQAIYLQQVAGYQQQLLNQPFFEYSPYFRDYYGAARHFRNVNPLYFLKK